MLLLLVEEETRVVLFRHGKSPGADYSTNPLITYRSSELYPEDCMIQQMPRVRHAVSNITPGARYRTASLPTLAIQQQAR